jgi:hypothetical protein
MALYSVTRLWYGQEYQSTKEETVTGVQVTVLVNDFQSVPILVYRENDELKTRVLSPRYKHFEAELTWNLIKDSLDGSQLLRVSRL